VIKDSEYTFIKKRYSNARAHALIDKTRARYSVFGGMGEVGH